MAVHSHLSGWVNRIVFGLAGVAGLNLEVPPVPVETGAIDHVFATRFQVVPVGHQPILVIVDKKVGVVHAEETAGYASTSPEPPTDCFQKLPLPVLLTEQILVGPSFPVGYRLPSGSPGNEFRQFQRHFLITLSNYPAALLQPLWGNKPCPYPDIKEARMGEASLGHQCSTRSSPTH